MESKAVQKTSIKGLMQGELVKSKFAEILGKNAPAFISSVTTLATTTKLAECEPRSVLAAAIAAASLNLQVTPTLGFAAIIPYKSREGMTAQFQVMTKGLVQLALRSGQFRTINVTEIYEGEMANENRLTGAFDFTGSKVSEKVVGYAAYFELLNGFSKALYMSTEQIKKHAKRFSKTYDYKDGSWQTNFDAMARKTVLKLLLSRYAPLSVEMQSAITRDQAEVIINDEMDVLDVDYIDNGNDTLIPEEPVLKKLEIDTKEYKDCLKALKEGSYELADIERMYYLDEEVTAKIKTDAGIQD